MALTPEQIKQYREKYGVDTRVSTISSKPAEDRLAFLREGAKPQSEFGFEAETNRADKLARIKASDAQFQKEAEEAGSAKGFIKNFGKEAVSTIASSEVGLGESVRKIYGNQGEKMTETKIQLDSQQTELLKQIRAKEAAGEDATKLKRAYNSNLETLKELGGEIDEEMKLPTKGEVVGQFAGTTLDLLTAGTYGKGATALKTGVMGRATPSILPKTAQKFVSKQTAKEIVAGGAIGYGFDVSQNLQDGKTGGEAFKPGWGTALGIAIPIAGRGAPAVTTKVSNAYKKSRANRLLAESRKVDDIAGQIVQAEGNPTDIAKARRALADIDITGVRDYRDLQTALDDKVTGLSQGLDEYLATKDTIPKVLDELAITKNVGGQEISHNYVNDSLDQLSDFYRKTNDVEKLARIEQIKQKAVTEGLVAKEINDIARLHGAELNAYNASGELASGLTKQAAENTRQGLKETARGIIDDPVYAEVDRAISDAIRTRELTKDMADKAAALRQRVTERSLGQKVGRLVVNLLDTMTGGFLKGAVTAAFPSNRGYKTLNAIDLDKQVAKNLEKLQSLIEQDLPEEQLIQKLQKMIEEAKTMPKEVSIKKKMNSNPVTNQLTLEARKYKSVEEFLESNKVYRGETNRNVGGIISGKAEFGDAPFVSFADNKRLAKRFGDRVDEHFIDKSKILDIDNSTDKKALDLIGRNADPDTKTVQKLKKLGYDGIKIPHQEAYDSGVTGSEIRIFGNFNSNKSKSQLTDIWNQANP